MSHATKRLIDGNTGHDVSWFDRRQFIAATFAALAAIGSPSLAEERDEAASHRFQWKEDGIQYVDAERLAGCVLGNPAGTGYGLELISPFVEPETLHDGQGAVSPDDPALRDCWAKRKEPVWSSNPPRNSSCRFGIR